jgi:ferredoxin
VGSRAAVPLSYLHKRVALAERVCAEEAGIAQGTTLDSDTFYRSKGSAAELHASALDLRRNFVAAGWILGGYVGIVFGSRLVRLCLIRRRDDYEPDRLACVSCARCFLSCPRERVRLADGGTAESGV